MCHCRFTDCDKRVTLVWDIDSWGGWYGAGDYVGALRTFHSSCQPTNYIPNIFKGTLSGVVVFKIVAIK